jgi:hypothetical protein
MTSQMWLFQSHDPQSDGLDYFRLFTDYERALSYYRKQLAKCIIEFDDTFKTETLLEDLGEGMIMLVNDAFIALMKINPDGDDHRILKTQTCKKELVENDFI